MGLFRRPKWFVRALRRWVPSLAPPPPPGNVLFLGSAAGPLIVLGTGALRS